MSKSVEAPPIKVIKELSLPVYESRMLNNGMPLYLLKGGTEPVMRTLVVGDNSTKELHRCATRRRDLAVSIADEQFQRDQLAIRVDRRNSTA